MTKSPFRAKAEQLSGGNIRPDVQHMAPDGHSVGPGASADIASKAEPPILQQPSAKPAEKRQMPFAAK